MINKTNDLATVAATPEFTGIARSKLERLQSEGWTVSGVHIQRAGEDGTHRHGAVTAQGMVLWWHGKQDGAALAAAQPAQTADSARLGIADAIKAACVNGYLADGWEDVADRIVSGAQPAQPLTDEELTFAFNSSGGLLNSLRAVQRAILAAAPQPAAQPEQEPECERCGEAPRMHTFAYWCDNRSFTMPDGSTQLGYTTPQEPQPLTDEPTKEMIDAAERIDWSDSDVRGNIVNMWQAMCSAAHGIKEAKP